MSIRLRFTLLYNAILAITLTIFGIALYSIQANNTLEAIKKELVRSSETIGESVLRTISAENNSEINQLNPALQGNPSTINQPNPVPPQNQNNSRLLSDNPPPKPFSTFSSDQTFQRLPEREIVRVLDINGNLVASPYGRIEEALPLSEKTLPALSSEMEYWEEGPVQDQIMLIYDRAIIKEGQVQYILQVARPLTERNHSLQLLRNTLFLASLITLCIAFGIGWLFSGITLQPIQRITKTSRMIGEERDFSKRVDYHGPSDEVGQLAATMNSMLSRLEDAYQQVAHSLSQQRGFVADVSHELRTPLTTLRGNLGLLGRLPAIPIEEQRDIIDDMVVESDRMIRLVNELLRLAHADAGRSLAKERIVIYPVLEECCRQIQKLDEMRHFTLQCPEELEIIGDMDAFKQIMLILLDNSIKHSTGDLKVRAEKIDDRIQIHVKDQGVGIPPEKLDHVFDRFFRGNEEPHAKGFGLGLPIAKSLVEGQGGNIRIESQPGDGCEVFLDFQSPEKADFR